MAETDTNTRVLQTTLMTMRPGETILDPEPFVLRKGIRVSVNVSAVQGVAIALGVEEALRMLGAEFRFACNVLLKKDLAPYK